MKKFINKKYEQYSRVDSSEAAREYIMSGPIDIADSGFIIREARTDDDLLEYRKMLGNSRNYKKTVEFGDKRIFLGFADGKLVTAVCISMNNWDSKYPQLELESLVTKKRHRGRGYAYRLCSSVIQTINTNVFAHVLMANEPSINLLHKLGFHPYSTRKNVAIRMVRPYVSERTMID
jgi:ribosomal protein S18 acetylase RimI-like enzyme